MIGEGHHVCFHTLYFNLIHVACDGCIKKELALREGHLFHKVILSDEILVLFNNIIMYNTVMSQKSKVTAKN